MKYVLSASGIIVLLALSGCGPCPNSSNNSGTGSNASYSSGSSIIVPRSSSNEDEHSTTVDPVEAHPVVVE